jgi:LysR family transcriptional regulator of gallate degradation
MEGSFDVLAADLRAGDIDFILGALRSADYAGDLLSEPLMKDRMGIFVRHGHPLTRKGDLHIDDLVHGKWILPGPGTLTRRLFDQSFAHRGVKPPRAAVETSDLSVLRDLLLNSDMLTAISMHWLYHERMSGDLEVLDFSLHGTERTIGLTQRRKSYTLPGASALMEAVRELIRSMQ